MQTKPTQSRFAHFLVRSICGITLATALITAGLAAYCWVDVQSFFAGAKPLEATIANLHSPAGEDNSRADRFRFDASLKQPVDGRQSVTMTGLFRVAAEDEGRAITVFHNPNHQIRWALSSPWNYIGSGVYGAISLLLLAAWGVLQLVLRHRKAIPITAIAAACVAMVSLAGTAVTAAETPLVPQEISSAPTTRHEAWSDGSFFPVINRSAIEQVEAESTLLWTVDAASWHEAMTRYHEWQGWKPYVPMDDDPITYTSTEEAEAARLLAALNSYLQDTTKNVFTAANTKRQGNQT